MTIRRSSNPLLDCEKLEPTHTTSETMEKVSQEEIDLQKYWFVLKRRWLPSSVVFVLVVALATLYALTRKPIYEAEARLLFQSSRASSLTGLLQEGQGNGNAADGVGRLETLGRENNPLDTQAEIVRSIPILQATITELNLKDEDGDQLEPEFLSKGLVVKGVPGTDILRIAYQGRDPKEAAAIVNKLLEIFIQNNIQSNRAEPIAAREFIADQLPKTELAVREADQALREFKERNGILVLKEEASAAVTSIATLNDQIAQTKAQLADVTAQSRQLQSQIRTNPQQAILYANLSQSSGVQDALTQLQQAQRELTVQQTRFISGPPVAKLEEKVAALDALLKERIKQIAGDEQQITLGNLQLGDTGKELVVKLAEVDAQRIGLVDRLNVLSSASVAYRERAKAIPALEKTQRELERRLDAAQKTYEALLNRLQAIQVAENQNIGNTRIVAKAQVPQKPVTSKRKLILGGAVFAGLLLAITTAFILDLLDRSVKTLKQAKEVFGYTVLGVIPTVTTIQSQRELMSGGLDHPVPTLLLRDELSSINIEAFQLIQANLKFLSSDKLLKTIVITSSVAAEGKSFVAANLAATVAQIGQRVLLVDADLRRPTQHHIWNHLNVTGLSNVIVEQLPIQEALVKVMPNLFLLPAGVIPPNPVALLDSNRMVSLIDEFSKNYDLIIFDSPPLAGKADAAILGKEVDGILFVVRPNLLDLSSAKAAKEFLTQSGQCVLGMVVNGVNVKHEFDGYFYYSESGNSKASHKTQRYSEI